MLQCGQCFCEKCPYGLKCYQCDRALFPHLYVSYGCDGNKQSNECLLKDYGEHENALRELIINNDYDGIEAYFNPKTGGWYK